MTIRSHCQNKAWDAHYDDVFPRKEPVPKRAPLVMVTDLRGRLGTDKYGTAWRTKDGRAVDPDDVSPVLARGGGNGRFRITVEFWPEAGA